MNPIVEFNGNKYWYNKKGQFHRTDGPAIVYSNGDTEWLKNGLLHRTDGPAIILSNGKETWYINGEEIEPIPNYIILWEKRINE